ncbi:MAG: CsbD family protein [Erysipelothrix sp.]|nr:CsbD family protein [Erysipelothrix sp.]
MSDKLNNLKDKVVGEAKEGAGKVTGDKELEAKGKAQSLFGELKDKASDAVEVIEDKAGDVFDKAKEKALDLKDNVGDFVEDTKNKFDKKQ